MPSFHKYMPGTSSRGVHEIFEHVQADLPRDHLEVFKVLEPTQVDFFATIIHRPRIPSLRIVMKSSWRNEDKPFDALHTL